MQSTSYVLLFAIGVSTCRAKVEIFQGSDISIEFDKPLTIKCTNDMNSHVEFRHEQLVVANCFGLFGCNIDDERFKILQNTSAGKNEYTLTSNNSIHTGLCGEYECIDMLSQEKDSAHVSIIGFDNDTYDAFEEKDTIYLTTACIFHVSLSDMQIYWYTFDNTTLKLLDETRMVNSMTPFSNGSVCDADCGTISAHSFTFGLNITDQGQGSTDVYIETKIFHPEYMNKPLTWRSSETFRVKDSSPKTPTHPVLLSFKVSASLLVSILIGFGIYAFIRFRRNRSTNTPTRENPAPLMMQCMRRLLSKWGKAATPRHTETQPVGESDGDLRYISRKNKHHLLDSCIHSQSDGGISFDEGEMVSIHDTETESDTDLQCIVGGNMPFPLLDPCIHNQSGEDLSLSLFEKEKSF